MKTTIKSLAVLLGLSILLPAMLEAQEVITAKFSQEAWKVEAQKSEFTTMKGQECLYLEHGTADLTGSDFKMGIITRIPPPGIPDTANIAKQK